MHQVLAYGHKDIEKANSVFRFLMKKTAQPMTLALQLRPFGPPSQPDWSQSQSTILEIGAEDPTPRPRKIALLVGRTKFPARQLAGRST